MLGERDWMERPSVLHRVVLGALAVPFVSVGVAFLAPAVWAAALGGTCWLCLWFGVPSMSFGSVLAIAATLPVGRARAIALDIALLALVSSSAGIAVVILHATLR